MSQTNELRESICFLASEIDRYIQDEKDRMRGK